jgi:site-specific recombinase XerD
MNRISVLFYVKKAKMVADGTAPLYMRVTVGELRVELSTKYFIDPVKWNPCAGKVIGNNEEARKLNAYVRNLEQDVYEAHRQLLQEGKVVTTESIKNKLLGKKEPIRSLVAIFLEHNMQVSALVGKEYAPATLTRYKTTLKHTIEFIEWKYQVKDIDIKDVNHEFITSFEFYLRSVCKCNNNSAVKYIKNFKKVIRICIANGWINKDPFVNYKSKVREVKRDYLNQEELETISQKRFVSDRLNQVRDIFLFSCFTGLAYADVKKLKRSEINEGVDGGKWIFTSRQKTETASRIPLLPFTLKLLERYKDHPQCVLKDLVLPVASNQKMNAYLKEIADICGITKQFTFHIARHTFATTVTLSNGVPIESVSKMLGHTNLRTTQHYAKILDKKVGEDMKILHGKFSSFTSPGPEDPKTKKITK